ncbi:MAG TPA: hypothetical protein DCP11_04470, partial [Microbacteriaceae bacterium]|nr:hypothetical protein [Microbacteriaceae bacterium]
RERAVSLPLIALGLVAGSAVGVATSGDVAASMIALVVVAVLASALCLGFGVGPPGALFFVLVNGVSSHLAAPKALDGAGMSPILVVGMLAMGCAIAYLVVLAPLALAGVRERDAVLHRERSTVSFRLDEINRTILERIVVGAAIAALVSSPLGIHRAYWVMVTVIAILQNGHRLRLTALRAVHRVLGTLVGVGVFALIALAAPHGVWLGVLLMALQFLVELVVIRNYGLALVLITPLALTIASQADAGQVASAVLERVGDTLLGATIALFVLLGAFVAHRVAARGR